MSVVVTKSSPVVIGPSEPGTPTGNVNLSSFDKCVVPFPVTSFLVFDHPIDEPVETIKRALSQALVHYHPIAGRLAAGADDGEVRIACTGEGVPFVGASTSCALEEVTMALLKDLAVHYPAEFCRHTDPLLLMQVTEFSCGGFVVGVTWNHVIADAAGMAQFLQAVGELARGMSPPSIVPVRWWDDSLPGLPLSMVASQNFMLNNEPEDLACLDITIPSNLISRIKAEFDAGDSNGQPCTVFEAVAAVLWQCRTRAVISDPEATAPLVFPSNVRDHVGAKDGYYGNCVTVQLVPAMSCAVANGDIKDLVKLIKRAKEKIPDLFRNGGLDGASGTGAAEQLGYNAFVVSSWRNLGFDAADFGGGRPARVMWHAEHTVLPGCVPCPPCKGMDGVNVLSLCVKREHADAFLGELASLASM